MSIPFHFQFSQCLLLTKESHLQQSMMLDPRLIALINCMNCWCGKYPCTFHLTALTDCQWALALVSTQCNWKLIKLLPIAWTKIQQFTKQTWNDKVWHYKKTWHSLRWTVFISSNYSQAVCPSFITQGHKLLPFQVWGLHRDFWAEMFLLKWVLWQYPSGLYQIFIKITDSNGKKMEVTILRAQGTKWPFGEDFSLCGGWGWWFLVLRITITKMIPRCMLHPQHQFTDAHGQSSLRWHLL